ncbi:site-specific integrase [Dactylosporangium sp. NPDC050588]|uniref:tyrosine-type recombinase/integrase n=1 Tax=Dactylosporangium sp. NPDC050588 TaxID=3157211 RepID=UPI003408F989
MTVYDLWFSSVPGDDKKRVPTKRHGRGKRWRVALPDGTTKSFERKTDAEAYDREPRSEAPQTPAAEPKSALFGDYAPRWRLSREAGWVVETRRRVESNLRVHLLPVFGNSLMGDITLTEVLEWLVRQLAEGKPKTSIKLYFELFDAILAGAKADKLIDDNPCDGVRLSRVLSGMSRAPKWVPTTDEVLRLLDAMPKRYQAIGWLGAGQGLRLGEALGMEDGPRCVEPEDDELHVVQQLRYSPKDFETGFYLAPPKSGSKGTVDLESVVADQLAAHVKEFDPVGIDLVDITGGEPTRRTAQLLFTTRMGNPFTDRTWSREWGKWRAEAGWPNTTHAGFHALRHFFATVLITNGAEPQDVQRAMRHKTLAMTLETYVGYWPKRAKARGLVGQALRKIQPEAYPGLTG